MNQLLSLIKKKKQLSRSAKHKSGTEKAFTLVDTMVTLALFILLTTIIAANYPNSQTKVGLANAVADVQGTVRDTQLRASAVQSSKDGAGGYGLYFSKATSTSFLQFKDLSLNTGEDPTKFIGNGLFDGASEILQTVKIPEGYHINDICIGNSTARPFDKTLCANTNPSIGTVTIQYPRSSSQPIIIANNNTSTRYAAACVEFASDKLVTTGNIKSLVLSVSGFSSTVLGACNEPPINIAVNSGTTVNGSLAANVLPGSSQDTIAPVLTLIGSNPLSITSNALYVDPGALAQDNVDGDLTSKIEVNVESVTKRVRQVSSFTTSSTGGKKIIAYNNPLQRLDIIQSDGFYAYKNGVVSQIASWNIDSNVIQSIAVASSGDLYAVNSATNSVMKITSTGTMTTVATTGLRPSGITINHRGDLYVSNAGSNNVTFINQSFSSSVFGKTGTNPQAIVTDFSPGNVYTADMGKDLVTKINPLGISSTFGRTGSKPIAMIIDSYKNIYTANASSSDVTKIDYAGSSSVLGTTGSTPISLVIDSVGNIYTANYNSHNVTKITPSGYASTVATTGNNPRYLAIGPLDTIYVYNEGDNTFNVLTLVDETTPVSFVDTNVVGNYLVRYSVSDSSGNRSETVRNVIVQ